MGITWGSSWLKIIFYDRLRDPSATGDTITQHTNRGFATSSQILPLFWIKVFLMVSITSQTNQLTVVEQPSRCFQYFMQGKYFIPVPQYLGTWPMPCLVHLSNSLAGCHDSNGGNSNASFERISWSILIHQNPNVIPSIFTFFHNIPRWFRSNRIVCTPVTISGNDVEIHVFRSNHKLYYSKHQITYEFY